MLARSRLSVCPAVVRVLYYSNSSVASYRANWCRKLAGAFSQQFSNFKITNLTVAVPVRAYGKKKKAKSATQSWSSDIIDLEDLQSSMEKAIAGLKWEYTHSVVSRMGPSVLNPLPVEFGKKRVLLKDLGQVSQSGNQNMIVNLATQPQAVSSVVKAIQEADLGLNPLVEGSVIQIAIPKISKEMREKMVKVAKTHSEKTKISVRKILQRGVSEARKMKGQVSEDDIKQAEKQIQEMTNQHIKTVDSILQSKTKELLGS